MNEKPRRTIFGIFALMIFTSTVGFSTANAVNNTALFFSINAGDTGSYSLSSPRQWNDLSTAQRNGTILGS